MENQMPTLCPSCHVAVSANDFFCPNCGKPLKSKPPAITISKQIAVYLVSIFLPPFGLICAWKYFKEGTEASKRIAWIAIILTVLSLLATTWFTEAFINLLNQSLISVGNLGM